MRGKHLTIILLSFLVGAVGAYVLHATQLTSVASKTTGKALIGGPFTMVDHNGKTVTEKNFSGRYSLVFFGFTHCPDVCPATLQVASEAMEKLGPLGDRVAPIFVSVDPERDTPETLKSYLANFDPRMIGLTGSAAQVRAMSKAYRIYYSKVVDPNANGSYTVDHSAYMYLMDPNGDYIAHFPFGTRAEALADKVRQVLSRG